MQHLYLCAGLMFMLKSYAQPIINQTNIPDNLTFRYYLADAETFDAGPAGADQTWDFSGLGITEGAALDFTLSAGTPYAATYPSATHVRHLTSGTNQMWQYLKSSDEKLEVVAEVNPGVSTMNYTNPRTVIEFPYTYERVFSDIFSTGQGSRSMNATYDAYGTLILPFGTYENVVRQKIMITGQIDYIWYNADPFYAIIETAFSNDRVALLENTTLGVKANSAQLALTTYPNPAEEVLHVKLPGFIDGNATFQMYDLSGKCVYNENTLVNPEAALAVGNLQSGAYLLRVTDQRNHSQSQIFVKK